MEKRNPIKRIFDLYTSDLSFDEIERLIKRDSAEVYDFFKSEIPKPDPSKNKFVRTLIFIRSLFNAFKLKLTAARRIFYLAALLIFFIGIVNNLAGYLVAAFVIVNLLLAFELADKLTAKDELTLARKIQNSLTPKHPAKINKYNITSYYEPAKEVSGDYYDVIISPIDENKIYLIVGDISGKGIAAALYMVRVQAIIHSLLDKISSVKEILINLRNYFSKSLQPEYFLTIVAASINKDGDITICRAGHLPVLHYKKNSDTFDSINPKGMGIGLNDGGIFEKTLEDKNIETETGDILLFYTDGLSETMNEYKNQFGIETLKNIIRKNSDMSVDEIRDKIIQAVKFFRGNALQNDDLTMIILKTD